MFDWDDANLEHIAEHGILPEDTEDAVIDPRRILLPVRIVGTERRRPLIGATSAGRILFVVFVRRGSLWRVVTARDAEERLKRRYRARK